MAMAKKRFEDTLGELEKIVQRLEDPDVPLEEAVALFEDGIKLSRFCSQRLDEVEKRVDVLLKDEQGNLLTRPFDEAQEQ
jgi:exodeoxyribonuclease VII small subunit